MAEFVEQNLEELLPVFEHLKHVRLFADEEVQQIIRKCRGYEYRLHKKRKKACDFLNYAQYMDDFLRLILIRRKALNYWHKKSEIDSGVRKKTESLYRRCSLRFQDRLDVWMKRLHFSKENKLFFSTSKIYARMLKVHGADVYLWIEAAEWEYHHNKSVQNSRLLLQQALRLFPQNKTCFLALFTIEIDFVKRLKERAEFLTAKRTENSNENIPVDSECDEFLENDSIMQFKLAQIVLNQALSTINEDEKTEYLLDFWRISQNSSHFNGDLLEKLGNSEEKWMAKVEMCENGQYEILDDAILEWPTEKMIRYYAKFCRERSESDPYSSVKLFELLKSLCQKGFDTEMDFILLLEQLKTEDKLNWVQLALQKYPNSAKFWIALLRIKLSDENSNKKSLRKLFNRAELELPESDLLPIYQLAVHWTLAVDPNKTLKIFEISFLKSENIANPMKMAYLRYLNTKNADLLGEYRRLVKFRPNSLDFHLLFINLHSNSHQISSISELKEAYENAILEFGHLARIWLHFLRFLS